MKITSFETSLLALNNTVAKSPSLYCSNNWTFKLRDAKTRACKETLTRNNLETRQVVCVAKKPCIHFKFWSCSETESKLHFRLVIQCKYMGEQEVGMWIICEPHTVWIVEREREKQEGGWVISPSSVYINSASLSWPLEWVPSLVWVKV